MIPSLLKIVLSENPTFVNPFNILKTQLHIKCESVKILSLYLHFEQTLN